MKIVMQSKALLPDGAWHLLEMFVDTTDTANASVRCDGATVEAGDFLVFVGDEEGPA